MNSSMKSDMKRFLKINIRRSFFCLMLSVYCGMVLPADDYQLLRSSPEGYAAVEPGRVLQFPQDHLPHEDYRIEWWYLTANLTSESGESYGIHWTLFRQSMNSDKNPSGWSSNQIWMAHAALSTPSGHQYEERFARGGIGQAGVKLLDQGAFSAWLDDWSLKSGTQSPLPGSLTFTLEDKTIALDLKVSTPWVLQGDKGFSKKSAKGQASYYYSQPHIDVVGKISGVDGDIDLIGKAWLDREWSSQPLAPDQPGWDWLSIHLDDGYALMIYRLRQLSGEHWYSGTWVAPDGSSEKLGPEDLVFEPLKLSEVNTKEGETRSLPLHWQVELPAKNKRWTVHAPVPDQWLNTTFPYWEGPVTVTDLVTGSIAGEGYLELTGH
jgi:predicted secreted hydrolase